MFKNMTWCVVLEDIKSLEHHNQGMCLRIKNFSWMTYPGNCSGIWVLCSPDAKALLFTAALSESGPQLDSPTSQTSDLIFRLECVSTLSLSALPTKTLWKQICL